jgi:hypothetical protein
MILENELVSASVQLWNRMQDLFKLINILVALQYRSRMLLRVDKSLKEPKTLHSTSSTNNKWVIVYDSITFIPLSRPEELASFINLPKAYVMIRKRKGDRGQP